jgi:hypothetical protein
MGTKKAKTAELECHKCKVETNHKLVASHTKEGVDDEDGTTCQGPYPWSTVLEVFQCQGCREFTIRRTENDIRHGCPYDVQFYPPRKVDRKRTPPPWWAVKLPDGMDALLAEVYVALETRSYRLAAMGLRTLLDDLMVDKVGDIGEYKVKVNKMVEGGYLSEVQRDVLNPTVDLGHAAIHRGHQPTGGQLDAALNIVEGMLHLFYVQSKAVGDLTAGVPPRPERKPAPSNNRPH